MRRKIDHYRESTLAWARDESDKDPRLARCVQRIESWLNSAPSKFATDLETRLLKADDRIADGALLELYTWKVLTSILGVEAVSIEPELPGGSVPDFAIQTRQLGTMYVECVAYKMRDTESHRNKLNDLMDRVAKHATSTGYASWIKSLDYGRSTVSEKRLAANLDDAVRPVDFSDLRRRLKTNGIEGIEQLKPLELSDSKTGFQMTFLPVPFAVEHEGDKGGSLVFLDDTATVWTRQPGEDVRSVLRKKRRQHRSSDVKILIVASCQDWPGDPRAGEIADVLHGSLASQLSICGKRDRVQRCRDGIWNGTDAYSNIAAVATTSLCKLWVIPNDHFVLWESPDTVGQFDWWEGDRVVPDEPGDRLLEIIGKPLTEIIGDEEENDHMRHYRRLRESDKLLHGYVIEDVSNQ